MNALVVDVRVVVVSVADHAVDSEIGLVVDNSRSHFDFVVHPIKAKSRCMSISIPPFYCEFGIYPRKKK